MGQEESQEDYMARMAEAATRQASNNERRNQAQQAAMHLSPEDQARKDASDAFRRKNMAAAGMSPADIAQRFLDQQDGIGQVPMQAPNGATMPMVAPPTVFSVLKARASVSDDEIAQAETQYAPDWALLKDKIKDHDGTWIVEQYEFNYDVALILGFFNCPGWEDPKDCKNQSFEAIVKNGRVFRTDPE